QAFISIPTGIVILKELEIPFLEEDKIRMVLDYEIEDQLPFSIKEATIDFTITSQNNVEKKSKLLVAAVRNKDVEEILDIYKQADIDITKITLDLFSIFNLYNNIPEYKNNNIPCAIVDIGSNSTRIALIEDNILKVTRVIPKGISTIEKNITDETNLPLNKIEENLKLFGFGQSGDEKYDKSFEKHVINFFNDIQFTLNSFSLKLNMQKPLGKLIFTGSYSGIKNLSNYAKNVLQISSEIFDCKKIFSNSHVINQTDKTEINWNEYITVLGSTLPMDKLLHFNLKKGSLIGDENRLIFKQIFAVVSLVVLVFFSIITIGSIRIYTLLNQIKEFEQKESAKIYTIFSKETKLAKNLPFKQLISRSEKILNEKLEIWGPFENQKLKTLLILEELTKIIDKKKFDVTIDSVKIYEDEEIAKVDVEGLFKAKTGSTENWQYFPELENAFKMSEYLEFCDPNAMSDNAKVEEDKGKIRFKATLKLKE
ncbi:pilus assembly protein PilM, partial [Candidatus Dependentiae bacterium]|nr:pilus assembly protein PilM [Candidatus Dependentiae bacterium]